MSTLFSPLKLRKLTIRNRVFVSPMCQYSAKDGVPGPWHLVHLGSRAVGGAGLVMAEATAVSPEGRISPGDTGIWNDDQAKAFEPIAAFIKEQGAVPAIQIGHAGRKASCRVPWEGSGSIAPGGDGWQTVAPSPVPFAPEDTIPSELSEEELRSLVDCFESAARRALASGFEVVEIHMAHGYLLHEFLSPLSNRRSDDYGGSLENRMRFPLQVAEAVRKAWPDDLPVFVRISATDWMDGGWDLAQSVQLSKELKSAGIDLVDCSSGGLVPDAKIPAGPGFQSPFAGAVRREAGIPAGAVGMITDPAQAEQIVRTGVADAVLLARELLRDPYWPLHAARALGADVAWPKQYQRAKPE
jgi:2,4-dienoyl-CoA reductase-like NADH-dependent reductase (Old Yellow Enzyme family)